MPGLETDPVPVAVKLVYEFQSPFGLSAAVDFFLKCHVGLHGSVPMSQGRSNRNLFVPLRHPQSAEYGHIPPASTARSIRLHHFTSIFLFSTLCPPRFYTAHRSLISRTSVVSARQLYLRVTYILLSAVIHSPLNRRP